MTTDELKVALDAAGICPAIYSLGGGLPNEAYVISREPEGHWVTYYSERGLRTSLRSFATESEACEDVLEQVLHDPSSRTAKVS